MPRKIPAVIRRQVVLRAKYRCEYCLIWQDDFYDNFQIDHIRSVKHGGLTELDNLALSCSDCNFYKGSDLGTYLGKITNFIRFFNPRTDSWSLYFDAFEGAIYPKTAIAEATLKIFQFNNPDRIIIRQELAIDGRWP